MVGVCFGSHSHVCGVIGKGRRARTAPLLGNEGEMWQGLLGCGVTEAKPHGADEGLLNMPAVYVRAP